MVPADLALITASHRWHHPDAECWGGRRFSTLPPSTVTEVERDEGEEEEEEEPVVWNHPFPSDSGWQLPLHRPERHGARLL